MESDIVCFHTVLMSWFFLAYKAFTNDEGRYLQKQEKKKTTKLNLCKMCTK